MTALNTDLNAMKAKLKEIETLHRLTRQNARETLDYSKQLGSALAEFHAGCSAMIVKYGPDAGLSDGQIQPLSGGEDKPPA